MNVTDALISRFTCRAFKSEPVKKKMILDILEAATRAPSWANTQPWEIFAAGGEVLENIREAFLENFHQDVPRAPENPVPERWPPALKKRSEELRKERLKTLGLKGDDPAARPEDAGTAEAAITAGSGPFAAAERVCSGAARARCPCDKETRQGTGRQHRHNQGLWARRKDKRG